MKITTLEISNYRNLDGIKVFFDDNCNFIVGENNLGKSNLLNLINILFTSRSFKQDDFTNDDKPIKIVFQLKLEQIEIGHFDDLFELSNYKLINIVAIQENSDENICFYHVETNTFIQPSKIKCINFIYYDSLRNPVMEINFDKGRGVGKFLRNIITQYLSLNQITDTDFLDNSKINELIESVNRKIFKIKSFQDFGIQASPDNDNENLLSKIIVLKDNKGDNFLRTGYGVQFLILVTLSILDKLQFIRNQRKDRGVFINNEDNSKSISIIIGLDEPEIHLHPYMQRSLIKFINSIINNTNSDFKELVKEMFDIDNFIGQIIIVTHSPNILLNNYKQIIRLFKNNNDTNVISGVNIQMDHKIQKHLYMNLHYFKEAFFSKALVFVEGESEYASLPLFGITMGIDFDDLGVSIIQAHGNAIKQLMELANLFKIPSVGITDKDDGDLITGTDNFYTTVKRDFEEEIVSLLESGNENTLRTILLNYDNKGINRELEKDALNSRIFDRKGNDKYVLGFEKFTNSLKLVEIDNKNTQLLKVFYITWFSLNKSYPLGLLIGSSLELEQIPTIYKDIINRVKELAESV